MFPDVTIQELPDCRFELRTIGSNDVNDLRKISIEILGLLLYEQYAPNYIAIHIPGLIFIKMFGHQFSFVGSICGYVDLYYSLFEQMTLIYCIYLIRHDFGFVITNNWQIKNGYTTIKVLVMINMKVCRSQIKRRFPSVYIENLITRIWDPVFHIMKFEFTMIEICVHHFQVLCSQF